MFDYTLHIDAYSPETIPMARLAEYMQTLAELLGHSESVHFDSLSPGSTRLNAKVQKEARPKVARELRDFSAGNGLPLKSKAWKKLDDLLADDNASGRLLAETDEEGGVVLEFPGVKAPKPQVFGPIKQTGSLQGILVRIGGADATVHLLLQSGDVSYSNIVCDRGLARELAKHLFEPVKVHGDGRWVRDRDGEWTLKNFRVKSFETLLGGSIRDALSEFHLGRHSAWPDYEEDRHVADVVNLRRDDV